jgi:arylsulfatase A-like enzyme
MGHNSTVNREMLHVPFILKLPDGLRDVAADTQALVSLEDVAPTMLALADVEAETPSSGFDLLSAVDRGQRLLIARAAGERGSFAAWTAERKIIVNPIRGAELFDLTADPDERHNLIGQQPRTFLCLRWLLDIALEEARPPIAASDEQLTDEELETLRSLGYIR